jgi:hypothetical protein
MVLQVYLEIVLSIARSIRSLEQTLWHTMTASMVRDTNITYQLIPPDFNLPGLIRFKIVIHCFIDGKSRYVTGIQASNNNRAETVLDLFMQVVHTHGVPSRVRGDHGTENVLVAAWMEERNGVARGSYIWGRSVIVLFTWDSALNTFLYPLYQKCPQHSY